MLAPSASTPEAPFPSPASAASADPTSGSASGIPSIPTAPPKRADEPSETPTPTTPTKSRKKKKLRTAIVVIGVVVALVVGFVAYTVITGDSDSGSTPSDLPRLPQDDQLVEDPSSPLLVPIDDARDVVGEIDQNGEEVAALDELGLDATGGALPAGYEFTTNAIDGTTRTVRVDAATGDHRVLADDGAGYSLVDGEMSVFGPVDGDHAATALGFGLDGLLTEADLVPDAIAAFTTEQSREPADDLVTAQFVVDVPALREEQPAELISWASPFGFADTDDDVTLDVVSGQDGRVRSFSIRTSDTTIGYQLVSMFDEAPTFDS